MDDKTLLELAAKAGGYTEVNFEEPGNGYYPFKYHTNGNVSCWWNALADDGDALRLAVKLGLVIEIGYAARGFLVVRTNTDNWQEFREPWGTCPYAATRRAIVRAAAALAEQGEKE